MNEWLEITLNSNSDTETERLEQALEVAGAVAITYQAADDEEIYEPPVGEIPLWTNTKVTGLFPQNSDPETIIFLLKAALGEDCPLETRLFADSEWVRAWLDYFQPIPFGKHFWVAATEHQIDDPEATVLRLDPGLAFGTGTHPSTAMCLDYLVNHADLGGKTIFDYGCGSGILGIAAVLAGAEFSYQTDIDPQALTATADNAEKNHVREKVGIVSNPDDAPQVDLLIANILLEPLCFLRPQFEKHIRSDSVLVFAGLLSRQEENIREVYGERYNITRINERDGWILLQLTPKEQTLVDI